MQIDKTQTINQIENLLRSFINKFQRNPFEYFYEEDIRADLLISLKDKINLVREFPTRNYSESLKKSAIQSSIIKAEYPSHKRFDIAILDYHESKDFYNQPILIAIEIKLGSHKIGADRTAGFKSDIEKLNAYLNCYKNDSFIGIAIYFCQTSINQNNIQGWYSEFSFDNIKLNQVAFANNNVYAIIASGEMNGEIYISKFDKRE